MSITQPPELLVPPAKSASQGVFPAVQAQHAEPASTGSWAPAPTHSGAGRMRSRLVVALVAVSVLAAGTYVGFSRINRGSGVANMQLFEVARRSFPVTLQEKGELKAASIIDVRCELEGKATIISLVDEGTHVKKGDVLVELASDEIDEKIRDADIKVATADAAHQAAVKELQILKDKNQSEIDKAKLTLWLAEQALEKYRDGESVQLKQTDELALDKAKYVWERAQAKLKDSEELHQKGFITGLELENDKFDVIQGEQEYKKAELARQVTEKYTIPMALEEKEAAVREAKKEVARAETAREASESKAAADVAAKGSELKLTQDKLAKLRDQKIKARVLAPSDGLVVYPREDWDEEPKIKLGAAVFERQRLIELPDTSSMKASFRVHEAKIERLSLGLPASVEIEGFSGRRFTGKVSRIAVLADSNNWMNRHLKEYETEVLLDGTFSDLKPGTTTKVEILITQLSDVLAVPVQSIFGKAGRYYVFLDDHGQARPTEVKIGLASTDYVEIKEGLEPGQVIRLAVSDDLKLLLPDESDSQKGADDADFAEDAPKPAALPSAVPGTRPAGDKPRVPSTRPKP